MDCVNVLQYTIWSDACGVVNKEYIVHISGVKGQCLGINEVFYVGLVIRNMLVKPVAASSSAIKSMSATSDTTTHYLLTRYISLTINMSTAL